MRSFLHRTCRGCGCTDTRACPGGCSWVLLDIGSATGICSSCAEELEWEPLLLASIGFENTGEGTERRL